MRNWETTLFGVLAALGQVFQHATGVPPWVNLVGEACSAVGVAGMGYTAASVRGVQKQVDAGPSQDSPPSTTPKQ